VCTEQAAKLQSTQKILQAYGSLIDMLYNGKKYAESAKVCRELLELKTDDGKEREILRAIPRQTAKSTTFPENTSIPSRSYAPASSG
jgi:hypothetical protein